MILKSENEDRIKNKLILAPICPYSLIYCRCPVCVCVCWCHPNVGKQHRGIILCNFNLQISVFTEKKQTLGVCQYHRVPVKAACKGGVIYLSLSIYITLFGGAPDKMNRCCCVSKIEMLPWPRISAQVANTHSSDAANEFI